MQFSSEELQRSNPTPAIKLELLICQGWELGGSEATFLKTVKVRLWTAVQSDQTVGDSIREGVGSWVNQRPSRRYRLRQEWVGSSQRDRPMMRRVGLMYSQVYASWIEVKR